MSRSERKNSIPQMGRFLFIAWGLTPAMLLVATGLWLGQSGIPGPDSIDFPGRHLKAVLGVSVLILFPWSMLLVRERSLRRFYTFFGAIVVTAVAFILNVLLAIGGCAAVDLTNEVFAIN